MDTRLESLIAQGGYAYIRNLVAAEAAVRRGEFTSAKLLRAAACAQRILAMRLARLDGSESTAVELLKTNVSELRELDSALQSTDGPNGEARTVLEQIAQSRKRLEDLLLHAIGSLETQQEILDAEVAQILWVCLHCGFVAEGSCPDTCPVCGAFEAEFAWFGPFYVETPEHLGRLSPLQIITTLETVPQEIARLTSGVSEETLTHRPSEEQWCVKEIVGHLLETDRLFARRAATILGSDDVPDITSPGPPWKLHEGKGYEQLPVEELLERLAQARSASLAIVRDLTPEQWSRRGALRNTTTSLVDLGIWLANHDLGHSAQIRRLCGK
jgi:rubrerythrin